MSSCSHGCWPACVLYAVCVVCVCMDLYINIFYSIVFLKPVILLCSKSALDTMVCSVEEWPHMPTVAYLLW